MQYHKPLTQDIKKHMLGDFRETLNIVIVVYGNEGICELDHISKSRLRMTFTYILIFRKKLRVKAIFSL